MDIFLKNKTLYRTSQQCETETVSPVLPEEAEATIPISSGK